MSVVPCTEVFWTIMSTFTEGRRGHGISERRPRVVGDPCNGDLGLGVVVATAVTTACSMVSSSSVTQVPGSQVKLERT